MWIIIHQNQILRNLQIRLDIPFNIVNRIKNKEEINMAKRGGFPGGMGGFGGMNINNLMKEAKKMQADMEKSQAELAAKEFERNCWGRSN